MKSDILIDTEEMTSLSWLENDLSAVDPDVMNICSLEDERQVKKLIMIPSESIQPVAVHQAVSSNFSNIYAEGYPPQRFYGIPEEELLDLPVQLGLLRRYADGRYYKGCEYADFIEALACRRAVEVFATPLIPPEHIHANVQPLSGAAANNAIYEALLQPGDTIMGMALTDGGHLTHGSPLNRSGKTFHVVTYGLDESGKLNYEKIMEQAKEARPALIIAGYSSYPWTIDWMKFREIADASGAYLMADIAHPAGLIAGGVFPNPVGYAHVISFTTHKTLCGPRGAVILTTDPDLGKKIDSAVFPGEQGGPHLHSMSAKAVCFQIAQTTHFKSLMKNIVDNCIHLAKCLEDLGLTIACGGTNTHLCLIDLKPLQGRHPFPIRGEIASRILDLCGIVTNKNTLHGDTSSADASGIRLGTTWLTQRGMGKKQMETIAGVIHKILTNIQPYSYVGPADFIGRGKIEHSVLECAKREVRELIREFTPDSRHRGYPYFFEYPRKERVIPLYEYHEGMGAKMGVRSGWKLVLNYGDIEKEIEAENKNAALMDACDLGLLSVYGPRAHAFLQALGTRDIYTLPEGCCTTSLFLDPDGGVLDDVLIARIGRDHFLLGTNPDRRFDLKTWLRNVSDGYVTFCRHDVMAKVEGPVVIEDLGVTGNYENRKGTLVLSGPNSRPILKELLGDDPPEPYRYMEAKVGNMPVRVVSYPMEEKEDHFHLYIHPEHLEGIWGKLMVLGAAPAGLELREAIRNEAGIPHIKNLDDLPVHLTRMIDADKPYFIGQGFLPDSLKAEETREKFSYVEKEQEPKPSCLFQEHKKLNARIVPFAGWKMPVWYESISAEHKACRESAALFDVTHMGILRFRGYYAGRFLDLLTTNYIPMIKGGQSQYSYVLDPDGNILDDIFIYCIKLSVEYNVVVNAANADKIKEWFTGVLQDRYILSNNIPGIKLDKDLEITDLKDPSCGEDQLVDIALQGPDTFKIIGGLTDEKDRQRISVLTKGEHAVINISGHPVRVARTGYTGEEYGCELYFHPDFAPEIWNLLVKAGAVPTGLGARDSTRCEAGFPLYGHELAGPHNITPLAAGYGAFVKYHKPFFVGRNPLMDRDKKLDMTIIRFKTVSRGARVIRPGSPIINRKGTLIGTVTSSVAVEGGQVGLAYINKSDAFEGEELTLYPAPPGDKWPEIKPFDKMVPGDRLPLSEKIRIAPRFMWMEKKAK
ncbi:MAG: serine hydroxymethyltransferase [Chloroflexi bacterium]|nr:serine hydroxymethyltransferase [Chloroflexota bacterium]